MQKLPVVSLLSLFYVEQGIVSPESKDKHSLFFIHFNARLVHFWWYFQTWDFDIPEQNQLSSTPQKFAPRELWNEPSLSFA